MKGTIAAHRSAWEWARSVLVVIGLFLLLRTCVVEAYVIPTTSMEPTLLAGDFLLVNKAVYGIPIPFTSRRTPSFAQPQRGDIVVFVPPHEPRQRYVKRVIGVPGDTVEMRERTVFVNGTAVAEPFAVYSREGDVRARSMDWQCGYAVGASACRPTRDAWGPIGLPPDRYLVLGDNRNDSEDSRYWGFVERDALMGRPMMVYYSFDPAADGRLTWATAVRWDRLGSALH